MIKKILFLFCQQILPKRLFGHLITRVANKHIPFLTNIFIKFYIYIYKISLQDCDKAASNNYYTFNDFFTRKLLIDTRKITLDYNNIISPVDAIISQFGNINQTKLLQAKNKDYSLLKLLANDNFYHKFCNGSFATFYLSPKHYHRVHLPMNACLLRTIYVPGKLFSVNNISTEYCDDLFSNNERLICIFYNK